MGIEMNVTLPRNNFVMNIDCSLGNGITGIFGPSGSGKTSLFNMIAGLERRGAGKIVLNGRTLMDTDEGVYLSPNKRGTGFVFQENLMFPHMTIKENLFFGRKYARSKKVSPSEIINLLNIGHILNAFPHEVSGGEQQRSSIGRALLSEPEILLLDEPFNAVDNTLRYNILPYLRTLRTELKIPMLVISHDFPDIQRLTDRVLLMKDGCVLGKGHTVDLLRDKTTRNMFSSTEVVNTLLLEPGDKWGDDLYRCPVSENKELQIYLPFMEDRSFPVLIRPNDIALSEERIKSISIQNQIKGRIVDIINLPDHLYCVVDCGVALLAEISADSFAKLNIEVGREIFCLFKAYSVRR